MTVHILRTVLCMCTVLSSCTLMRVMPYHISVIPYACARPRALPDYETEQLRCLWARPERSATLITMWSGCANVTLCWDGLSVAMVHLLALAAACTHVSVSVQPFSVYVRSCYRSVYRCGSSWLGSVLVVSVGVLPASDFARTGAKLWSSHVTAQRGLLDAQTVQC